VRADSGRSALALLADDCLPRRRLHTRFIINPRSGHAQRALEPVRTFAAETGAEVVLTERSGHASDLARQALADRCDRVIAVGGDGTMNEVARVLVDTPATLGLVPCGSGDGLGRHLGIHGSLAHALTILRTGIIRSIDTGLADGRPFFTVAGLGFEAEVATRFNQLTQRGFLRYLQTAAAVFRAQQAQDCVIEHDGQRECLRAFTLAVANSDQYGNNARIAPGARVDDGLLNLTVIPPINGFNALPLLARLFSNTLDRSTRVVLRKSASFTIEQAAPGPLHVDGETYLAGTKIQFHLKPRSLRILVPSPAP